MRCIYYIETIVLLFVLNVSFGQSFYLGAAANFVLFTSNGAISNTASSTFIGNIGSDVGAISGFGSCSIIGSVYNSDSVTAQAKIDLFIAYNQLISIPATVSAHTPAFGSGETLTTGVYDIAAAGSLAGNLTLDGLGDTNAVFIFRFGGAYAVGASSKVILVNGTRPCNIFWVAEGAISMAASTTMKGTLIANNSAISMAASGNIEGRIFSTTGAIAFGPDSALIPNCLSNISIPPPPSCCHPSFGTTIDFVLFTSSGGVTNSGTSSLTRNIGSNAGIISGFETATITGSTYNADSVTTQAKTDLSSLYNQLSINPTTNASHTPSFGDNETLYTGVYYIAGAGSLGGILTLDARGDTNAVFIFKIRGAFVVGASSTIVLLNSASACSVFWTAEGAISIGASSIVKGTFIANNAAVSMAANSDLRGRLFSTTGAVAFNQSTASNADACHTATYALPIELLSFTSECYQQSIDLKWVTITETNNDYFSIERSTDGINWQVVVKISGANNSTSIKHYSFIDV